MNSPVLTLNMKEKKNSGLLIKDTFLKHKFFADCVVFNKIILKIKSIENIHDSHINQCINYLKVSNWRLAIIANFHKELFYRSHVCEK